MLRLSRVWLCVVASSSSAVTDARALASRQLARAVLTLHSAPAYLRHAPPSLYVTCDVGHTAAHSSASASSAVTSAMASTTVATAVATPQQPPLPRHAIRLLDCACAATAMPGDAHTTPRSDGGGGDNATAKQLVPHTEGVYVLTSTTLDDVDFVSDTAAVSTLVGVPAVRSLAHAEAFVRHYADVLARVRVVALPEVTPTSGCVLKLLYERLPHIQVVCSAFAAAFLSDAAFFHGVRTAVLHNCGCAATTTTSSATSVTTSWSPHAIEFAALPASALLVPTDEDMYMSLAHARPDAARPLSLTASSSLHDRAVASMGRTLRVVRVAASHGDEDDVDDARRGTAVSRAQQQQQQQQRRRRAQLPHYFAHDRLFFYDSAFACVFVGRAIARLPWLPHILPLAHRAAALPLPALTAAQCVSDGTLLASSSSSSNSNSSSASGGAVGPVGAAALLLRVWSAPAAAQAVVAALRRLHVAQFVCSSCYGELPGDVDDVAVAVTSSAQQLEQLRSRLARRLATDTQRDVVRWSRAMLPRVVDEVLCHGSSNNNNSSGGDRSAMPTRGDEKATSERGSDDTDNDGDHSSTATKMAAVRSAFVAWAATHEYGALATALAQAALTLPPSTDADVAVAATTTTCATTPTTTTSPRTHESSDDKGATLPHARAGGGVTDDAAAARELTGDAGVRLLSALFAKKGLQGLTSTLQRQDIDVRVFATMTADELRSVFRATFGVVKRLQLLQTELNTLLAQLTHAHEQPPPRAQHHQRQTTTTTTTRA